MKSVPTVWRRIFADWKLILLLALPMFVATMWYGISRGFDDLGLFAAAMAIASIHIADMGLLVFRRMRELFNK